MAKEKICKHSLADRNLAVTRGSCPLCLQAEVEELKEIFRDYGRHLKGCNAEYSNKHDCTCGFEQALKEVK